MKPKYSIIIATKNEEEAIAKVLCSIPEEVAKYSETIVVDSSTDYTPIIAERLGAKVIKESRKGKGRAMKKGVKSSKGDVLIFLDGDGTDPPEYTPKLIKKLNNSDLVLGCRSMECFETDDKMMRQIFRVYGFFVRPLFYLVGFKVSDPLAGFRVIRRKDWDKLDLKSNDFEIEAEMNVKATNEGFVVKELAIPHLKRGGGLRKSKLITNPKMWFRIMNVVLKYIKDEKLKVRLEDLREKLK
ncbi:MAG: glycosyltransferase family 2 protein [Methanosarcinales archaeon Met12]|nr:MAG: glycosyltransferase family 2 protein [Methanosarcinales archaeon Met12]